MKNIPDLNAKQALNERKFEISKELNIQLSDIGIPEEYISKNQNEINKNKNLKNHNPETFNPS